jgi:hypothetical protein
MTIHIALERAREVDVHVVVASILRAVDAREVRIQVVMDVGGKRKRSPDLVIDRGMEWDRLQRWVSCGWKYRREHSLLSALPR